MGTRSMASTALGVATAGALSGAAGFSAVAQTPLTLELNRLETVDGGCRVDLVVEAGPETVDVLTLDLVLFNPAGLILRRLAVEAGPAPAGKRRVRAFLAEGLSCDSIGSALVNGVIACEVGGAPVADCERGIATRSRLPTALVN